MKNISYLKNWQLNDRQICDLELIMNGGFSPLNNFMSQKDYNCVIEKMTLSNGKFWPIPIVLDVDKKFVDNIIIDETVGLRDKEGFLLASLKVKEIWEPNLNVESELVYGTNDISHPGVNYLYNIGNPFCISGHLKKINFPQHYDFSNYRHTPDELKNLFENKKWEKIVAFQTRNPLHKAHVEMTKIAIQDLNLKLLIHPVVGLTKPGDVNHYTRVRCYEHVVKKYNINSTILSLLPLAMRMAGPREALLHAVIRKNYGCSHLIVGRDHAGPGLDRKGQAYYGSYDAQNLLSKYERKIGIKMIPFKFMVYVPKKKKYMNIDEVPKKLNFEKLSGSQLRELLNLGKPIPDWFTYRDVAKELQKLNPKKHKRGLTIFFTGLSGSGKSTLANGLLNMLLQQGDRRITLLDGDIIRTNLSSELGFSRKDRSVNVQRIGFVASEITKHGGIAICAPIAPYRKDRLINRSLISQNGGYIEIYVNTPLSVCEERDSKGLYKLAREGKISEFTGISDPYEEPENPEIIINSSNNSPQKLVKEVFSEIKNMGYIK